jgi:flavodoxin
MYEVVYFSRGGNTRKVAAAIANELNVKARHVISVKTLSEDADLFLGSGLYLLRPSKSVRNFIINNDFHGKKVALFGTSTTGIGIEVIGMERLLKRKGAVIIGKYYCPGKFMFLRKQRPADKDLEKAKEFARTMKARLARIDVSAGIDLEKQEERVLSRV